MWARFRTGAWDAPRPYWMGVVNITPDSFSDGGRFSSLTAALAHAELLIEAGADVLDLGGEATNPRATPVSADVELSRILPVVRELCAWRRVPISVDTTKAAVARAAVEAGAEIINDISGGGFDPAMHGAVRSSGAYYIAGHLRGGSLAEVFASESCPSAAEVVGTWRERVGTLADQAPGRVWFDPGLGMGKGEDGWAHLALIREATACMVQAGLPVVIGASRKRFVRALLRDPAWAQTPLETPSEAELDAASASVQLEAIAAGAKVLRVHDVAGARAAHARWLVGVAASGKKKR